MLSMPMLVSSSPAVVSGHLPFVCSEFVSSTSTSSRTPNPLIQPLPSSIHSCTQGSFASLPSIRHSISHRPTSSATTRCFTSLSHSKQSNRRQGNSQGAGASGARRVAMAASSRPAESQGGKKLVVSFGEMLIDFVPTVNGVALADAPGFIPAPGGAPANVAVGVRRLGGEAAFVGKVGDEEFGRMLVRILEENGVDVSAVKLDPSARTALAFVTLKSDGEREFMFYRHPSADMLLTPEELDADLIAKAAVVHYGSISLIAEPCRSAHLKLLDIASSSGAILSYDANLRLPLWPSAEEAKKEILSIWDKANVAKLSDEEIFFLTDAGAKPSEAAGKDLGSKLEAGMDEIDERALSLWHPNLRVLLVTEGNKGCRYYMRGAFGKVPGFKVEAIDATGAGDAFVAGFLVQLAESPEIMESEERLRKALALANACGAITATKRGAIPSLPTREAAEELMHVSVRA